MRILHTAHSYAPEISGVAEVVGQISKRLAKRGHQVHVATSSPGDSNVQICDGVSVRHFKLSGNAVTGLHGTEDYVQFVLQGPWDLVVMHCAQTGTTDALLPYLDKIQAKKIFVGHGFSTLKHPAYQAYFESLATSLRQVDRVVGLSELLEEHSYCIQHHLPLPQIIPNGVDLDEWNRPMQDLRRRWQIGGGPWIVAVSNHSTVKGHPVFFDVIRRVSRTIPNVIGTIIGDSYPAAKWDLGRLGIQGGCWYKCHLLATRNRNVVLRTRVSRQNTVSAVTEADLILITSWREAAPLVALESMAAGTPWLAFDVGCIRENTGGIVVSDPKEMTAVTVELLGNPARRKELGIAGQQRVLRRHDWEKIVDQYEQLYTSLLEGH